MNKFNIKQEKEKVVRQSAYCSFTISIQRAGRRSTKKLVRSSKHTMKKRWYTLGRKIKRISFRLKIHGFTRFRQCWFQKNSSTKYTKLE